MKITNAAALALATFPVSTVAASSYYHCKVDGDFQVIDTNPPMYEPNANEQAWATSRIRTSYKAHHGRDWDMTDITLNGFEYTLARGEDGEYVKAEAPQNAEVYPLGKLGLRGGADTENVEANWLVYDARLYNGPTIMCDLCGSWDDDDAMRFVPGEEPANKKGGVAVPVSQEEQEMINKHFSASIDHDHWELAWCDELNQGPHTVFKYAESCILSLYDCTTMVEEGAVEEGAQGYEESMVDIDQSFN